MTETPARQCERYWKLADARAAGSELSAEDQAWVEAHRRSCDECALEQRLAALTDDLDAPGPAPQLDELARHRWAGAVIERFNASAEPQPIAQAKRRRWPLAAIGLAAAAGLAAIVIWRQLPVSPQPLAPQDHKAQLVIVSGSVQGRLGTLRAGERLSSGEQVRVDRGLAGFTFCGGASVFLSDQTRLTIKRAEAGSCGLTLQTGRVVVRIGRLPRGVKLEVSSGKTRVRALGTVFAVEAVRDATDVRVLRGVVKVDVAGRVPRRLSTMEGMRASGEVRSLQGSEADRDWQLAAWSDSESKGKVLLNIASIPPGARVAVDGKSLGQTPVTAFIKAGQRQLEVRPVGGSALREVVELRAGDRFTRVYTLVADGGVDALPVRVADASAPRVRPKRRKVTASTLLTKARALRVKRKWAAAADAYRLLLRRFPDSGETRAALVPYGQILLERLSRASSALKVFERYLRRLASGPLAEEAAWGKIRALRRLSRPAAERAALQRFIRLHPSSMNGPQARRRLQQLSEIR